MAAAVSLMEKLIATSGRIRFDSDSAGAPTAALFALSIPALTGGVFRAVKINPKTTNPARWIGFAFGSPFQRKASTLLPPFSASSHKIDFWLSSASRRASIEGRLLVHSRVPPPPSWPLVPSRCF